MSKNIGVAAESTASIGRRQRRQVIDRLLSVFANVRKGEGIGALLLAGHVFLLLSAYYILKTVRESLILSEGGAEIKTYSSAAQEEVQCTANTKVCGKPLIVFVRFDRSATQVVSVERQTESVAALGLISSEPSTIEQ